MKFIGEKSLGCSQCECDNVHDLNVMTFFINLNYFILHYLCRRVNEKGHVLETENCNEINTNVVPILGDGRCFFKCIVVDLFKELLEAHQSENGLITNYKLTQEETSNADELRRSVVNVITTHKQLGTFTNF